MQGSQESEEMQEMLAERLGLSEGRISEIRDEYIIKEPYGEYFRKEAGLLLSGTYDDMKPEAYGTSYANPVYAVGLFGTEMGRMLSFLAHEIFNVIPFRAEGSTEDVAIINEVFLEVYGSFETAAQAQTLPDESQIHDILYSFVSDYTDETVAVRIREMLDPSYDFAVRIIMDSDLNDLSYLEKYGEYVTDETRQLASFLNSLPEADIQAMADTFTEGFRMGFVNTGKDLSKKKTVMIEYNLGFERVVRAEILNFRKLGLETTTYRKALHAAARNGMIRRGYFGELVNEQMDYDHREDCALFMDKAYVERKLEVVRNTMEEMKEYAYAFAGPAVMERFGGRQFIPVNHSEAYSLSPKQRELYVQLRSRNAAITNEYIKGDERSFTIISYPVPSIGKDFEAIFRETVKINTLPYKKYEEMQQAIIKTLELGEHVEIRGRGRNITNMKVMLHELPDKKTQSVFENCVADVNIPVGEVFTSPRLHGTCGKLFVTEVYLNGLKFENLEIDFSDGYITDYKCTNFAAEEENRKYIEDNILFNHKTLPTGEFAIGTNTTAYAMARKYGIADKLQILIAEKTGPHFAVGDTCYSHAEDVRVYNPDGREIISKDNELTLEFRKTEPMKAYFLCHTDITIPYDELAEISSVAADGTRYPIIKDGRFAVCGAEDLNLPLDKAGE